MKRILWSALLFCFISAGYAQGRAPKYSVALRNAQVAKLEQTVGPSAVLRLCGGATPANVATLDGGPAVVTINLPEDWASDPEQGVVTKLGAWRGVAKIAEGVTHLRLYEADGITPHLQAPVTGLDGGGIITIDKTNPEEGNTVRINTFSITAGGGIGDAPPAASRVQYSIAVQNAMLDSIAPTLGTSPIARVIAGDIPETEAEVAADPGLVLATIPLPNPYFGAASGGSISKVGTWQDSSADASGNATHITFSTSGGTPHIMGQVTGTGGGGFVTLDNVNILAADLVTIPTFVIDAGNQ